MAQPIKVDHEKVMIYQYFESLELPSGHALVLDGEKYVWSEFERDGKKYLTVITPHSDPIQTNPLADFLECEMCSNKPGSPQLCESCVNNRDLIFTLKEKLSNPTQTKK